MPNFFKRKINLGPAFAVLLVGVLALYAVAWYQPVRSVLHNNTTENLLLMEEHDSQLIGSKQAADVGRPRRLMLVYGQHEPSPGGLRFESDGAFHYRAPSMSIDITSSPPKSWVHERLFWREFHYQYDSNGELSLVPPPSITEGKSQPIKQPEGFPICLHRIDSSKPNSGFVSQCSGAGK